MKRQSDPVTTDVDLDGYFARIGYAGPREPTLEVLRRLHELHPAAIAFEAIDVLLGRGISLDPRAVDAKLIGARRGGYCFEQNSLFQRVLRGLGFRVEGLIARSRWGRPLEETAPRTHMSLRVRLDEVDWLADVGFGGCMLTTPIRLDHRGVQRTRFEPVRLVAFGDELRLEAMIGGSWRAIYDLALPAQSEVEFVSPNWFTSTHPESAFRRHLIVTRTTPTGRFALLENRLTIRRPGATTVRSALSLDDLERSLAEDFGLPVAPEWRPLLHRAVLAGDGL